MVAHEGGAAPDDRAPLARSSYAIAIHNYSQYHQHSPPGSIDLNIGELVEIISEKDEWYFGRRVCRNPNEKGIFPKSYVKLKECSVDRTGSVEVVSIVQPQLVQEITHTLREWGKRWKHLYVTGGEQFKIIEQRMRALIELRISILSGKLPVDQLKKLQRSAIYTMDIGNRELNLDLTVRCSNTGVQIDPKKVSAYQLYNLHVDTSESIKQRKQETHRPTSQSSQQNSSYSFFASVRNFVCKMSEDAELLMSLYDVATQQHFTESYVVRWSKDGLASDIDQLHNLKVLFTDLGTSDIKREKVFLVCYVIRIGSMEPQVIDNRRSSVSQAVAGGRTISQNSYRANGDVVNKSTHVMRRPLGVAAMDVTHILSGQVDVDDDKHHCVTFFPCEKENLESLLKKIITNKDLKGDMKTGQGLWLSVKLLRGDIKQIREELPHLIVGNVSIARKMGFPEVILPSDARNDLYICLVNGSFTRGSTKSSDRNIQVTVRVCNQYGQLIPGVIYLGGGVQALDEYNSVVYYHEDRPKWFEVFKICVPIEEFKSAHVLFLFKHRSSNEARDKNEKPFALSFTPLMQENGTTLNDIEHCLRVYKIESKKWTNDIDAAACYLNLPSLKNTGGEKELSKSQKGFLSHSPKDSFVISTTVCSTKLTQNVELLGVLNWCDHKTPESLRQSLISLQEVPGSEVVKFLQDILDALFSILTQAEPEKCVDGGNSEQNSRDYLVFDCLLFVISLVSDRKYHNFQPVLDLYIKESFSATLAYKKLCSVLSKLILEKADQERNEVLLKSMKCLEYLMRFIVKSRQLHAEFTQKSDQHDFQQLFLDLLNSIIVMMQCNSKNALTSQGSCIKYLPPAVEYIIRVFPDTELAKMIGNMLDVLPLNRLTMGRLMAVLDLVQGPLFRSNECRFILLPHITKSLKIIIKDNNETNKYGVEIRSKNRSVDKIARLLGASKQKLQEHRGYSEELELCLKILGEILALLFTSEVKSTDKEFNHLSSTLLSTIIFSASEMDRSNPLVCQLISIVLEMMRQMNLERYNTLISMFTEEIDLISFLVKCQMLFKDLLEKPVFLSYWADMINLQNCVILKIFKLFSCTLIDKLLERFHQQVWSNWFHLSISFLTQPCLQLEQLSSDQRRRLTSHYGDMRIEAALQIRHMWFNLGQNKILFIPELISPFLEMSLIPEYELRKATIPLFFDMMQCEYNSSDFISNTVAIKGNFQRFEDEMIHKLDALVEGGLGDAQWRTLFCDISENQWIDEPNLKARGEDFVKIIGCLLDTLLQYRAAQNSSVDHKMQATTTLLDFYSKIKRPEMYIRYVNKLCDLHLECENWTEAALTLRLHAMLLQWSNLPLNIHLKSHRHPDCQTHRDLKEALYFDIIEYFNKGKMWELAVGVCKELVMQYEDEIFDYCNLSELHSKMAHFYYSIMKEIRPQPEYFRVAYYGNGFAEFLRNKVFIYRGKDYDRLQDFSARALNGLPNAELMNKLTPPTEDILNSPNQHLQINAVEPIMCETNKMTGKQINDQILKYYKSNEVTKFRYSRKIYKRDESLIAAGEESSQNEFASLWLERTELEICDKLPGILRWFPVVKSKTYEMCPLEVAIDSMSETNRVLKALVIEYRTDNTLPLDPLTRKLNGLVDAAVMGGIVNYENAFFTDAYINAHPDHKSLIKNLKDLIAAQIPLLEIGIELHRIKLPQSLIPLHQRISECFEKMKSHVYENYGKKVCDIDRETPFVTMRRQISSLSNGFNSPFDNRWSEISTQTHNSEVSLPTGKPTMRMITSHINKQINRGSFSSGSNNYNLGLSTGGLRSVSILTPTRRKDKEKRKARKNSEMNSSNIEGSTTISGTSQWYTGSIQVLSSTPNSRANSANLETTISPTIRELRQEDLPVPPSSDVPLTLPDLPLPSALEQANSKLIPSRPLRSEVEKEKRLSQRPQSYQSDTNSNRNSAGSQIDTSSQLGSDIIEAFNFHLQSATDSSLFLEDDPPPLPQKTIKFEANNSLPPATPSAGQDGYYLTLNFSGNRSGNSPKSGVNTPILQRQDYDQVAKPRGSFLYSSLQPRSERKKLDKAPTPPPKKRIHFPQQ